MLNSKIQDAFNAQINAELYSSYLYLAMAAYFDSVGLSGFSNWMKVQVQEEAMHAMKFYDYINERGGRVALTAIDTPDSDWSSPLAAFEHVCAHEAKVTASINNLMDLAIEERDHASSSFLQWFVTEQVEEEATAGELVQQLRLVGEHGNGIFMMDRELGQRVFTAAATSE